MMKKLLILALMSAGVSACVSTSDDVVVSPKIDTSNDRVKSKLVLPYKQLGVVIPKNSSQTKNNLTVGCETVDRDYTDYDAYKEYLAPLGIKKIRLQGGWAKTEKVKGVYNFAWLDHIVNDAISRGITPWVQTSYGNQIYNGGGTPFLKGGMPCTKEGKDAWNRWVEAIAKRYAGKVEWEMWNEPDINRKTPKMETVDINVRTTNIILKHDPKAKIAGLSLASTKPGNFEIYVKAMAELGMLDKFTWLTYHGYEYRPEASYVNIDKMREILAKYSKKVLLRQGENGAPSKGYMGGALAHNPWTEYSQAKWDLRRMLGDWGRGIETSVFSISDMNYFNNAQGFAGVDQIKIKNVKGLLGTDDKNRVIKIKMAYYAVQNLVSVFELLDNQQGKLVISKEYPEQIEAFGYIDNETRTPAFTIWFGDNTPSNLILTIPVDVELKGGAKIKEPVWVDILSGKVCEIPASAISRSGNTLKIKGLHLYDSPVLITDKSVVDFRK
ncbi:MAG: hypothetical protein E7036_01335 [Opitutales bacterium]|nr:hypothetical protein [Opitutales bacterium]